MCVPGVDVGAVFQERSGHLAVALPSSRVKSGVSVAVLEAVEGTRWREER